MFEHESRTAGRVSAHSEGSVKTFVFPRAFQAISRSSNTMSVIIIYQERDLLGDPMRNFT